MNGNMCPFTIIHDRWTDLYGYFRNACVTSQERVALPVNLVELRCQSGASELTRVGVGAGLMDELFDFLIVKMVGGIFTLAFRIAWFFTRIVWWLTIYLILSVGAGVAWLARGRRGREVDTGRFGRFLGTTPAGRTPTPGQPHSADPANQHWYANRYSRPLISWDAPIAQAPSAQQIAAPPSPNATADQ